MVRKYIISSEVISHKMHQYLHLWTIVIKIQTIYVEKIFEMHYNDKKIVWR